MFDSHTKDVKDDEKYKGSTYNDIGMSYKLVNHINRMRLPVQMHQFEQYLIIKVTFQYVDVLHCFTEMFDMFGMFEMFVTFEMFKMLLYPNVSDIANFATV